MLKLIIGYWVPKETQLEDRGTPVIGSIRCDGKAEPDDDWQEDCGRCIPKRYGKGKDIYALEFERSGRSIVVRNIPPREFREGQAAVYCWNGWEAEGWFGRADLQANRARIITEDGKRHDLDPLNIVRIGKVVGRWPRGVSTNPSGSGEVRMNASPKRCVSLAVEIRHHNVS